MANSRLSRSCQFDSRSGKVSNPYVALPTSQLILQPFRRFTYVTAHSPTLPLLHLRHSSFSNPSVALPTSQLILQLFHCFTYVTAHSSTLLSLLLRHKLFSYVTWRAAHGPDVHAGAPRIFSDLLRSVQMLKREWGEESNGKLPHLFIPSKTATWFLSLRWKTCLWADLQPWCLSLQ